MASCLKKTFPCVPKEVWYCKVPGRNATGYLQHRIGNVRRRLCVGVEKRVSSGSAGLVSKKSPASSGEILDTLSDDQFNFRKTWLKDFREPASQVKLFLDETFARRRSEILDKSKVISFTLEWPALFYSPESINNEFRRIETVGQSHFSVYEKWPTTAPKILEFCQHSKIDVTGRLNITSPTYSDEQTQVLAAMVLPFVFNSCATMTNKKKRKIPNASGLSYFIQFYPVGSDLQELADNEQKRTQPFIILLGQQSNLETTQFCVMVERKHIFCSSFLQALDLCFKLFHVLNIHYLTECQAVWEFFESFIYGISEPKSILRHLIAHLE